MGKRDEGLQPSRHFYKAAVLKIPRNIPKEIFALLFFGKSMSCTLQFTVKKTLPFYLEVFEMLLQLFLTTHLMLVFEQRNKKTKYNDQKRKTKQKQYLQGNMT